MKLHDTELANAFVIEPRVIADARGHFFEGFNARVLNDQAGCKFDICQVNHSKSSFGVLRGLHYQVQDVQAKIIWVAMGSIYDVIVDLRQSSSSFGKWFGTSLSCENARCMLVPQGFAHGFIVTSETARISYLTSDFYNPEHERTIRWNCPVLDIDWPEIQPNMNERDACAPGFLDCETFP